jgi:hypothetical protein
MTSIKIFSLSSSHAASKPGNIEPELLGHKTVTMTLRYSHLAPVHKVKAMDILNNALNGKLSLVEERLFDADYIKTIQSVEVR